MARSSANYIPRPDGDFNAWAQNYAAQLTLWWEQQGLDIADLKPLSDALIEWDAAWPAHVQAQAAAQAAREAKDQRRLAFEAAARPLARQVQAYPSTTDADRAMLGLRVPKEGRTPSAAPTTRPTGSILSGNRLALDLSVVDELTPTSRAKPRGVRGAQVWQTLIAPGEPIPKDPRAFRFLNLTTKPTLRATFTPQDGGKTAVYLLRWVSTRNEPGPWSDPVTGTVAA
jgi:hypothetical protein